MCGAKNASVEMRSNVTFVSRMGSFVLDYHTLNAQPPFQHIEIPSVELFRNGSVHEFYSLKAFITLEQVIT